MSVDPSAAETVRLSGYAINGELCGAAPNAYPKLKIGMREGYCAGLVASGEDGLIYPRSIVQVPGRNQFVVADMGGWSPGKGRLLLLDPSLPPGKRISELIGGLDFPFGLAVGPDNKVYATTDTTIFRFDPLAPNPRDTIETVLQGLPGRRVTLADGTKIGNAHPLKQFIFDRTGRIFVSIGAPTDSCVSGSPAKKACAAGEGAAPLAAIWVFTPPSGGIFAPLKKGEANPPREIFARGLRNSMALAAHPKFPSEGFAFLQGENARDLPDPMKPNEELNALEKGKHYGWPYCYDLSTPSPEFAAFLKTNSPYRNFCTSKAAYRPPHSLLPPHAAPLGMLYYHGEKFPELVGRLIVGLHGYRPTGSRIVVYEVDAKGFPHISSPPVRYGVSCVAEPTRVFQTESEPQVAAAPFVELVSEWHKVNGVRPRGAPVGMTVASDGAIWLVEDKNRTVIRIDTAPARPQEPLPCDAQSPQQIAELIKYVEDDAANRRRLTQVRTQLVEKHCLGCHADFDLKKGQADVEKDATVLRFLLSQDGWVYPGDPEAGRLHTRVWGKGAGKIMPADGKNLIANQPGYRQLLASLDLLVAKMVPGQRMRVRPGGVDRKFYDRRNKECGAIPTSKVVVVVDRRPKEKPDFSRIYRPPDLYLNGECSDDGGYYIEQRNLVPL